MVPCVAEAPRLAAQVRTKQMATPVQTVCKLCSEPQGITHSLAAHWLAPKQEGGLPNLIAGRSNHIDVYSILHEERDDAESQQGHWPSYTLMLEHTEALHGQVQALACLSARRANQRDSVVAVFDEVRGPACTIGPRRLRACCCEQPQMLWCD